MKEKIYGIVYKVTNKVNEKMYVGQTVKSLSIRISEHIHDALKSKDNVYFHNAIRKYGKENFIWKIIAECNSFEELNKAEIEMIGKYNTFENGYNLTKGGEGILGRFGKKAPMYGKKHSEKTRKRISELLKGEGHPMYGKHLSEEVRQKISIANKGKSHLKGRDSSRYGKHQSKECKEKISRAKKGTKHTEESKRKISLSISGENNPMWGKHHTEETKKKIGLANSGKNSAWYGRKHTKETIKKMSKAQKGERNHNYDKYGKSSDTAKKYIVITPEGKKIFVHGLRNFCKNYKDEKLCCSGLIRVANGERKHHKSYKCKKLYEEVIICQK